MKKFSTAAFLPALASSVAVAALLASPAAMAAKQATCEFQANAPDQHKVVKGDTLWDISGKFLKNPWCWPQVWGMNKDQIKDPHWIYPGQIVYFDRVAGQLRLGKPVGSGASGEVPTVHMKKQIRAETLANDAIPTIPTDAIEPFLSQPLIVEENQLKDAPRVIAVQEGRVMLGRGDVAYVLGNLNGGDSFQAFRPGRPLKDPTTKEVLGYEAVYLGSLKLNRAGTASDEAHRFVVTSIKEEIGRGDLLVPIPPTPLVNYVPHPPTQQVDAQIMSIYGGVAQAGQNQVVSVNRGKNHGLDRGAVLSLYRKGGSVMDKIDGEKAAIRLPDEKYGALFIFRVFDNVSYGLIMQVTQTVQIGDVAKSPE